MLSVILRAKYEVSSKESFQWNSTFLWVRCHIQFKHAFTEMHCVLLVLTLFEPNNVITRKMYT